MTPAATALREAQAAGVSVRLDPLGTLVLDAEREPPASLLQRLRDHKPKLIQILKGDACRWCGTPLDWPRPAGITFADGTTECMACADAEVERIWRAAERVTQSADARADPAEVMLRGEIT